MNKVQSDISNRDFRIECRRISKVTGTSKAQIKNSELSHLRSLLLPQEQVLALTVGYMGEKRWLVALTNHRVFLIRKSVLAGLKEIEIGLNEIGSIDKSVGLIFGRVTIKTPTKSYVLKNLSKDSTRTLVHKLRMAKSEFLKPDVDVQAPSESEPLSEFEQLAHLRDTGALSEREFAKAKKKLGNVATKHVKKSQLGRPLVVASYLLAGVFILGLWGALTDEEIEVSDNGGSSGESEIEGETDIAKVENPTLASEAKQNVDLNAVVEEEQQRLQTEEVTTASEHLGTYYVTASVLNERDAPNGEVIGKVHHGQAVQVTEVREGWARIDLNDSPAGWVALDYLSREKTEPFETAAFLETPAGGNKSAPFTIKFEDYEKSGKTGGNLHVWNSSPTEYNNCRIELGDNNKKDRWYLANHTVIDRNGHRSYPTFIFRDRQGITPPSPAFVTKVMIRCTKPSIVREFDFSPSTNIRPSKEETTAAYGEPAGGIGLSRGSIQSFFASTDIGFRFENGTPLMDGRQRTFGTSPNGITMIELIGPSEDLSQVTLMLGLPNDNPAALLKNTAYLVAFLTKVIPEWPGAADWVGNNMERALRVGKIESIQGSKKVSINGMHELAMIFVTVKAP